MTLDLSQFHQSFFEESFEALDAMEAALLKLDVGVADHEGINTIFRGAHSMKGGAAMLGFEGVASFTHTLETLLDELRSGRMHVSTAMLDTLLKSVDVLREMLRAVEAKKPVNDQRVADVQFDLELLVAQKGAQAGATVPAAPAPAIGAAPNAASATSSPATPAAPLAPAGTGTGPALAATPPPSPATVAADANSPAAVAGTANSLVAAATGASASPVAGSIPASSASAPGWIIHFKPLPHLLVQGNDPLAIFAALQELGALEPIPDFATLPPPAQLDPQTCYLSWQLKLHGTCTREQVQEAFDWTTGDCELTIEAMSAAVFVPAASTSAAAPTTADAPTMADARTTGDGRTTADAPPAPALPAPATPATSAAAVISGTSAAPTAATAPGASVASATAATSAGLMASATRAPAATKTSAEAAPSPAAFPKSLADHPKVSSAESNSIRVGIDKIDELINTVGELVITQAMLSEIGRGIEGTGADLLRSGLAQLERNMRQLQESVMRVRMLPISVAFSRFPRMVHDLAQRLDKKIELKLAGEQTELDKTVLEKIGDPLVHLVRNSIDHGIETPDKRTAAGKSPFGTVSLNAYHSGGSIAVEVSDDGAGLDKDRILAKARSRGLVGANDVLTDDQIHDLIFLPGFSTAEKTTEVSGRGVGMDVVRQRVKELGGNVEIRSERGKGTGFRITLPLTLAIVDGQSVVVGSESYIVPLTSIVESLQLKPQNVNRLSGAGELFSFRGDYLPLLRLYEVFGLEPRSAALQDGLVVVAEGDGKRVGLFVDELLGQQQVVIKSMETNYGRVEGISGATILGDGSVALILDVPGLIRSASARVA